MSKESNYEISTKSLQHRFYIIKDSVGNRLAFSRYCTPECKLTINSEDLVKFDFIRQYSPIVAIYFANETALNNILFSMDNLRKFRVKGDYYHNGLKEINWKWKAPNFSDKEFYLVDKNNKDKKLAYINGFILIKELTGSVVFSEDVPSEFRNLIVATACLVFKVMQDLLNPNLTYESDLFLEGKVHRVKRWLL
ncbi:hypothetical protein CONCODRAFT_86337 [Conidiobolus coronatus NRRL 28638]|uniref:Uncharacterized protein n=1 Tax=Conidiobolus coronatus (strain ATCC 28846 / CBS 209.66 / NRRL 28638) TaxID=796925 RepID=A0A137P0W8_CONC2|nr:hypothetical protein CONCODRAFT_86337 [Conidiobolus coronatus NRRL 28638]|eukprot:KXN68720.1 hypothetical protein CONCODRAFT_86337 [Conidiobolus coronatus NRRL 28638]